ncbi:response regulator transcription factor [Streptomyces sp. NPDC050610]|uniref:response regulator transcription factor n=1 Tax=Streptomyces sp. NPDC050610 TaxID=3157097 RepID=UPI003424BC75
MIRVPLADDEAMIRAGVRAVLSTDPGIEVLAAEARDGLEAVELARGQRPDVVLLDVRMPGMSGLAAAAEIKRTVPGTAAVMLTAFSEDEYIARALGEGVSGFLLKSGDPRELPAGVRAVAGGAACLSPKIAHRVIDELDSGSACARMQRGAAARNRIEVLTGREREVLALVGAGLSNAEIAQRLHVVEGTVKSYMSAVLSRLQVRNRVQAAVLAHEAGLVDEDD